MFAFAQRLFPALDLYIIRKEANPYHQQQYGYAIGILLCKGLRRQHEQGVRRGGKRSRPNMFFPSRGNSCQTAINGVLMEEV